MPKKRKQQKLAHLPTDQVIEKLFPKKAVDHMRQIAHQEKKVEEPSQSPQQEE